METNEHRQNIVTELKEANIKIEITIMATGQKTFVTATNRMLHLTHGRMYKIPITNKTINSDELTNIKVFSEFADKIDVRFVKEGYAYIIPVQNNFVLKDDQRICIIW